MAGETSLQAMQRELFEETGIHAAEEEFHLLGSSRDSNNHYDFYSLKKEVPLESVVLLPGETDAVRWASFEQIHTMIRNKEICRVIANQFLRQEKDLLALQSEE